MKVKLLIGRVRFNKLVACIILGVCAIVVFGVVLSAVAALRAWLHHDPLLQLLPPHLHRYVRFPDDFTAQEAADANGSRILMSPEELRKHLERLTYDECEILHWKRFGAVQKDTTIIVVQVHRDAERLQYLIVSLAEVLNIHTAMLVFSHSYYDPRLNSLIRDIRFCKVMQIFYPYSVQANPDRFPGVDPNDCLSGRSDDAFCVERDAHRTEHKQHWWWKAHYVFESLEWSGMHRGMVIFLEEATYVAPDLLHMLRFAQQAQAYFPQVMLLSFGRPYAPRLEYNLLAVDAWQPPYDVGLAFNKTTWRRIAANAMHYCMFDDCSWSYSLLNLFSKLPAGHAEMVAVMAPRVVSTSALSPGSKVLTKVRERLQRVLNTRLLFPVRVRTVFVWGTNGRVRREMAMLRGTGGWSDLRDQLFCVDPLMTTGPPRDEEATTTLPPIFNDTLR